MKKTVLGEVRAAVAAGTFVHTRSTERAILHYVRNSQNRYKTEDIDSFLASMFRGQQWPIDPAWNAQSVAWLRGLVTRKDGEYRDTLQTRRLGPAELRIAKYVTEFKLVAVTAGVSEYDMTRYPGHERAEAFCVYRAVSQFGVFDFFFLPWQSTHWDDPQSAGIHLV